MNAEQEASELEGRGATGGENHRTRYPAAELELLTRIGVADQKTMLMMIDY